MQSCNCSDFEILKFGRKRKYFSRSFKVICLKIKQIRGFKGHPFKYEVMRGFRGPGATLPYNEYRSSLPAILYKEKRDSFMCILKIASGGV